MTEMTETQPFFRITDSLDEASAITRFDLKPEGAVLGAAIISLLSEEPLKIILAPDRTQILAAVKRNQTPTIKSWAHIYNVGGIYNPASGCFDCGAGSRENDLCRGGSTHLRYGAAGLLWYSYGIYFVAKKYYTLPERLARHVAQMVDDQIISLADQEILSEKWTFLRALKDKVGVQNNALFIKSCQLARQQLLKEVDDIVASVSGRDVIKAALEEAEDKKILILPSYFHNWRQTVLQLEDPHKPIFYTVLPPKIGKGWRVETMALPNNPLGQLLPKAWRGLQDQALAETTGIPDVQYCAPDGRRGSTKTVASAVQLASLALNLAS